MTDQKLDTVPNNGLTEVTVNLIPEARQALQRAASRLGDTETEAVNRALQLYEKVCTVDEGVAVEFEERPGDTRTLVVYDAVPADRWRPAFTHGVPVLLAFIAGLVFASLIWWGAS